MLLRLHLLDRDEVDVALLLELRERVGGGGDEREREKARAISTGMLGKQPPDDVEPHRAERTSAAGRTLPRSCRVPASAGFPNRREVPLLARETRIEDRRAHGRLDLRHVRDVALRADAREVVRAERLGQRLRGSTPAASRTRSGARSSGTSVRTLVRTACVSEPKFRSTLPTSSWSARRSGSSAAAPCGCRSTPCASARTRGRCGPLK